MFTRTVGPTSLPTRRRWAYEDPASMALTIHRNPTGIGNMGSAKWWRGWRGKRWRGGSLPRRRTTRSGRSVSAIPPRALSPEEGEVTVWRCPLYVLKQPLHPLKTTVSSGELCIEQFFPLMAQRRWKPDSIIGVAPMLFGTPRLLAKLSGARHRTVYIQDYSDAMLGLNGGKRQRGSVARLGRRPFERSALRNVDNVAPSSPMMNKARKRASRRKNLLFQPVGSGALSGC